jgi:two-component system chemotaxis sensor kinase CheA
MLKVLRDLFASLKERLIRQRLTVINAAVTVVLIGAISTELLWQESNLQRRTAEESMVNLVGVTAQTIQTFYLTYFDTARTVAQLMKGSESIVASQRRAYYNDIMLGVLASNRNLVSVFTVWRVDGLDGMDAQYANTPGTDESGQYITGYSREKGWVEIRAFPEYKHLMDVEGDKSYLINDYKLFDEHISDPSFLERKEFPGLGGRQVSVVTIRVPVMHGSKVVGFVGVTVDLELMHIAIRGLRPYGEGQASVYTRSGVIATHQNPQLWGTNGLNAETAAVQGRQFTQTGISQIVLNILNSGEPSVIEYDKDLYIGYPMRINANFADSGTAPIIWALVVNLPKSVILEPIRALILFSIIFIIIAGALAAVVIYLTSRSLTRHAQVMQRELERATAMQDNLKYGLCLLDHDLVIQEAYSKALERVLAVSELQGKNFIELLSASLKIREAEGVKDYFNMIFNRSFEAKMLEDINPISEFSYVSTGNGETKTLRTTFSLTGWGQNADYILATLEDITAERELTKQLKAADDIREREMNSLFQVIQLNPRILIDFIEDTEYEFEQVNKILRSREIPPQQVVQEIYQSVHAIKSDALILNLEHFANGLHKLESSIKILQEKEDVPFDDILGIVFELETVMKEKDRLKEAITKIENFRSRADQSGNQETYILTETLNKICSKAKTALHKNVRLVKEQIDETVLIHGPRRIIKEVLTQLVRNAVYHGIETGAERQKAGKDPMGEIHFAIWRMDDKAHLKLDDDGCGINYEKVIRRAREMNLIKNPADAANKDFLLPLLFTPGFSTAGEVDMNAGRGVGLSLVRDRVKELKGTIKIRTEPGKGTSFIVSFPLKLSATEHEDLTPLI